MDVVRIVRDHIIILYRLIILESLSRFEEVLTGIHALGLIHVCALRKNERLLLLIRLRVGVALVVKGVKGSLVDLAVVVLRSHELVLTRETGLVVRVLVSLLD